MKKILQIIFINSIIALLLGAFYREFTKYMAFDGQTVLSVIHTHTFMLMVIFPLLFVLIAKNINLDIKEMSKNLIFYYIWWIITISFMFIRWIIEVSWIVLSYWMDKMISWMSWLWHIIVFIAFILIFLKLIKKSN